MVKLCSSYNRVLDAQCSGNRIINDNVQASDDKMIDRPSKYRCNIEVLDSSNE